MDNGTKLFTATCLKYYPFGLQTQNSWTRDSTVGNNFLYDAGNELNTTTGVYETMFRGYDPALGRFMQVDPLALYSHTLTPYHYAANNPVNFNDPTGLKVPLSSLSQSQQNALYRSSGLFYDNYNEWAMDYQAGPDGGGGGVPDGVYRDSKGRDFYVQGGEAFVRSLRTMDGSGGELVSAKGVLLLEEGENSNSSYQRGSFLQQAADAYLTFRSLQQLAQPNSDEPQFLSSPDISSNQSKFPYNGVGLALNVIGAGFTPVKSDFRQLLSTVTKSSIKGMAVTGKVLGAAGFAFTAYQFGSKVADPNQQLTVNDYMDFGVGASTFVAGLLVANPVGVAVVITVGVGYGLYTIWRDNGN